MCIYFESYHRYIPEIIGKGGSSIHTLKDQLGVHVTIPSGTSRNNDTKVKILIAGPKEKVAQAKTVIKEITEFYHSSVTHPGVVHAVMDCPDRLHNLIIGPKGSEIRHIENNFKVSVYIPNAETVNKSVVVVGESEGVSAAHRYMCKIISQAGNEEASAAAGFHKDWGVAGNKEGKVKGGKADVNEADEGPEEEWMKEYMYSRSGTDTDEKEVKATAKFPPAVVTAEDGENAEGASEGKASVPAAAATTWSAITSSEGW